MSVRAKMHCHAVEELGENGSGGAIVHLRAVYGDSPENKSWSKHTPSGDVRMSITNPDALKGFAAGVDYFLDFTPVDEDQLAEKKAEADAAKAPAPQPDPAPQPNPAPAADPAPLSGNGALSPSPTAVQAATDLASKGDAPVDPAPDADADPVKIPKADDGSDTVSVTTASGTVDVPNDALVAAVKTAVPEASEDHIQAAVDEHHDATIDGVGADTASAAAMNGATDAGATPDVAAKIAAAIPVAATTIPAVDPAADPKPSIEPDPVEDTDEEKAAKAAAAEAVKKASDT